MIEYQQMIYIDADIWGYYYVKQTVTGRGLALYKGDWIKPIYDDGNNHIYLQKSNGTSGWFTIDGYNDSTGKISDLFACAG